MVFGVNINDGCLCISFLFVLLVLVDTEMLGGKIGSASVSNQMVSLPLTPFRA